MVGNSISTREMDATNQPLPKTGFNFTWRSDKRMFWDDHNVVALAPKKIHKSVMGLDITEWIPATKVQSDSNNFYVKGPVGPSGHHYQAEINGDIYEEFKSDLSFEDVFLHPDSDCNTNPIVIDIEGFYVIIAPLTYVKSPLTYIKGEN